MSQTPFILFMSARSPFARRIRLLLRRLELPFEDKAVDVFNDTSFGKLNPLGMVPTLLTPQDGTLSDSANILEYLHELTGKVWPSDFRARTKMRQISVFGEGIMQSSILFFQEQHMHDAPSPRWLQDHVDTILDTCDSLSRVNPPLLMREGKLTQPGWDFCVGIQYADFRIPGLQWKEKYPSLVTVLDLAMKDSWFQETMPRL